MDLSIDRSSNKGNIVLFINIDSRHVDCGISEAEVVERFTSPSYLERENCSGANSLKCEEQRLVTILDSQIIEETHVEVLDIIPVLEIHLIVHGTPIPSLTQSITVFNHRKHDSNFF
jgi:uncharacterized membrane protein